MTSPYGPCDAWPVRWTCDVSCESPTTTGLAVRAATEVLWNLTGQRFGQCTVTLRPCRRSVCGDYLGYPIGAVESYPLPALVGGLWYNLTCGCVDDCSCVALELTRLPAPVRRVLEVRVDGVPLVTGAYRVLDDRTLVRTDGGAWPTCNDLSRDDTEVGTWSVTAEYGEDVPAMAALAVGELACELVRGMGGDDCRLPRQVTQLARQGVTIQLADTASLLRDGLTGLTLVDTFVVTWNPRGLRRRAQAYSVDGVLGRRAGT